MPPALGARPVHTLAYIKRFKLSFVPGQFPGCGQMRCRRYDRTSFGEGKQSRSEGVNISQRAILQGLGVLLGVGVVVYASNQEGVPVTKRSHLILFPISWEPSIGKAAVKAAVCCNHSMFVHVPVHVSVGKLDMLPRHRCTSALCSLSL